MILYMLYYPFLLFVFMIAYGVHRCFLFDKLYTLHTTI